MLFSPLQHLHELPANCQTPNSRNLREPLPAEEVSPSFGKSGRLPEDPKNLELIVRDVDAKGYLDIELAYRLRRKESLGSAKQKIARKIQQNESVFCFEDLVMEAFEAGCVQANDLGGGTSNKSRESWILLVLPDSSRQITGS